MYTASVSEVVGYITPASYTFTANSSKRYLNFIYQQIGESRVSDIKLKIIAPEYTSFTGKTYSIYDDSSYIFQSATIDSNGEATFTNVPFGKSYNITPNYIAGYVTPSIKYIYTNDDIVGCNIIYTKTITSGIYIIDDQGNEYDISSDIDSTKQYEALHIATEALISGGNDYYIKLNELSRTTTYTMTDIKNTSFTAPGIPLYTATNYEGVENTYKIAIAWMNAGSVSSSVFSTLRNSSYNGMKGYLGTWTQYGILNNNFDTIKSVLSKIGISIPTINSFCSSGVSGGGLRAYPESYYGLWNSGGGPNGYRLIPLYSKKYKI